MPGCRVRAVQTWPNRSFLVGCQAGMWVCGSGSSLFWGFILFFHLQSISALGVLWGAGLELQTLPKRLRNTFLSCCTFLVPSSLPPHLNPTPLPRTTALASVSTNTRNHNSEFFLKSSSLPGQGLESSQPCNCILQSHLHAGSLGICTISSMTILFFKHNRHTDKLW